jgi:4-methylaminobutanoate oxidase (formaldehyde-forming)
VTGPGALDFLQHMCANDVGGKVGKITYSQMLNSTGGIECDFTVSRLAEDRFLIVTGTAFAQHDFHWISSHRPTDGSVEVRDLTSSMATFGLWGPRSRDILSTLTDDDLSFGYMNARRITVADTPVWALRVTYVGELGWELYIPTEFARGVFDAILATGPEFGLKLAGLHALDSCRIEKAYRHWGHDIGPDDSPLQAGLMFAVKLDNQRDFIGRDALLRQRETGPGRRLVQFRLRDSQPMLYHDEPIWHDGEMIGRTTSGAYGHHLGAAIALGYVEESGGKVADRIAAGGFEIEIAGRRFAADASLSPLYDPKNTRIRV